ncbi:uncharacterized protein LOC123700800 [Colias croceus]|uniref:uncharacterized protein LOC123700800 n=1 Tax=Colias crocea TaxID=72248 RepID=UPI001E27EF44|nr:uncharacterized protein LOC123700800 [Colias croceus]XP_045504096.1 uncharacterized protein LOC123700800 [Colias croceus]
MASTCIHDSRMVCATSPDGCTRRSFLDQCDMYEYNCDYGTRYQETYILFCASYMGSSSFTSKDLPQTTTHNDGIKNETQILNKTLTNMTDCTCNETKTDHDDSKIRTTNSSMEDKAKSTEQFTNVTQRYTITNSDFQVSSKTSASVKSKYISAHTITQPILIKKNESNMVNAIELFCCNRPRTWETTTENIATIPYYLSVSNSDKAIPYKRKTKSILQTEFKNITLKDSYTFPTTNSSKTAKDLPHSSRKKNVTTTKYIKMTPKNIMLTEHLHPSSTNVKSKPNIGLNNCNRPKTWDTTLELLNKWPITNAFDEISAANTQPLSSDRDTVTTNALSHTDVIYSSKFQSTSVTRSTLENLTDRTKRSTLYKDHIELKKRKQIKISSSSCKTKCQRPHSWITTTKKGMRINKNYI